jgi:hypothetical protein
LALIKGKPWSFGGTLLLRWCRSGGGNANGLRADGGVGTRVFTDWMRCALANDVASKIGAIGAFLKSVKSPKDEAFWRRNWPPRDAP